MKYRALTIIGILLLSLMLLLAALFMSHIGLQSVLFVAQKTMLPTLTYQSVQGTLAGPMRIEGLSFEQNDATFTSEQIDLDWHPLALLYSQINIKSFNIRQAILTLPSTSSDDNAPTSFDLASIMPFVKLKVNMAQIEDFTIKSEANTYTIDQLTLQAEGSPQGIHLQTLQLAAIIADQPLDLNITGTLSPTRSQEAIDLNIDWRYRFKDMSLQANTTLLGNLEQLNVKQQLQQPISLDIEGYLFELLTDVHWDLNTSWENQNLKTINPSWPDMISSAEVQITGSPNAIQLEGDIQYPHLLPIPIHSQLTAEYVDKQLSFNSATHPDLPERHDSLELSGQLNMTTLTPEFNLTGTWRGIIFPVLIQDEAISSPSGHFQAQGSFQDYSIQLNTELTHPLLPHSQWDLQAHGNTDQLILDSGQIESPAGHLITTGQLDWQPKLIWQSQTTLTDIDLSQTSLPITSLLNGQINTSGEYGEVGLSVNLDVESITGTWQSYPLQASGELNMTQGNYTLTNTALQLEDNRFTLNGHYNDEWALEWMLDAPHLHMIYPTLAGALNATGQIRGKPSEPHISTKVSVTDLQLDDWAIANLSGDFDVSLAPASPLSIRIEADNIKHANIALGKLELNSHGRLDNHTLELSLTETTHNLQMTTLGHYQPQQRLWQGTLQHLNVSSTAYSDWQLASPVTLTLSPTQIQMDTTLCLNTTTSAHACIWMDWQPSTLDVTLDALGLPMAWLPVPASLLERPGVININGSLNKNETTAMHGEVTVTLPSNQLIYEPDLLIPQRIPYQDSILHATLDEQGLQGELHARLGEATQIDFTFALPEFNQTTDFKLASQPVNAHLLTDLDSLGFVEIFVREVSNVTGIAHADLDIEGTLGIPIVSGIVEVSQTSAEIPDLNLQLKDIFFSVTSTAERQLTYTGGATSGEGTITLNGETHFRPEGRATSLNITGENFTIINIPEAHVHINPDLTVNIAQREVKVTGEIFIPSGQLGIPAQSQRKASDDVIVITSDEAPAQSDQNFYQVSSLITLRLGDDITFSGFNLNTHVRGQIEINQQPNQPITANGVLQLVNGRYEVYGQRLMINNGEIIFTNSPLTNPGLNILAERNVNIQTNAGISLLGTPTTQETIPGIVGVQVTGTINAPIINLYSDQPMSDADKLSYLILNVPSSDATGAQGAALAGAFSQLSSALGITQKESIVGQLTDATGFESINIESSASTIDPETGRVQSQTSLVLGRSLGPRISLSYSVGLLDPINTLYITFRLASRWSLQTQTSSQGQGGGDIFYRVDLGE